MHPLPLPSLLPGEIPICDDDFISVDNHTGIMSQQGDDNANRGRLPAGLQGTRARTSSLPRSHNRVWINPHVNPYAVNIKPTKESALTDTEIEARMGLLQASSSSSQPSPQNQHGKRTRKDFSPGTKAQMTPGKKAKGNKNNRGGKKSHTPAQKRLTGANVHPVGERRPTATATGAATTSNSDPESSSAAVNPPAEGAASIMDESPYNAAKAKSVPLARLMGASKRTVAIMEKESLGLLPKWKAEQLKKKQAKLFPPKPETPCAELLELAEADTTSPEAAAICRAAAKAIDKGMGDLHKQADG